MHTNYNIDPDYYNIQQLLYVLHIFAKLIAPLIWTNHNVWPAIKDNGDHIDIISIKLSVNIYPQGGDSLFSHFLSMWQDGGKHKVLETDSGCLSSNILKRGNAECFSYGTTPFKEMLTLNVAERSPK